MTLGAMLTRACGQMCVCVCVLVCVCVTGANKADTKDDYTRNPEGKMIIEVCGCVRVRHRDMLLRHTITLRYVAHGLL